MNILKINLISYKSKINRDFFSANDIKIKIKYNNYNIVTDTIKNQNNSIFNQEFIIKYYEFAPLIITVYETDNTFGDVELFKEIIYDLKEREYINKQLKYYYEIIFDNDNDILLDKFFNILKNYTILSKIKDILKTEYDEKIKYQNKIKEIENIIIS